MPSLDPDRLNRREFLAFGTAGMAATALSAAPLPAKPTGVIVLDDCDPQYKDKDRYEDNLSFYDAAGKLLRRVSGLNNCEEISSPHKIAVDVARGRVWVTENVGHRLLQYDLSGREQLNLSDVKASALAVDPSTGNVWVARSTGRIGEGCLEVFSKEGRSLKTYESVGWDLAYDPKGKVFWLAGKDLVKVSLEGKVLFQKQITTWCAASLAVNPKTGAVWVANREHTPAVLGKNELLGFDNEGQLVHSIPLKNGSPFRVAVDPNDGTVWVTIMRGPVLRYTADGKADGGQKVTAIAADVDPHTGDVWVVTEEEVLRLNKKGETVARAKHEAKTTQSWIVCY
jgi:hypothetical protein